MNTIMKRNRKEKTDPIKEEKEMKEKRGKAKEDREKHNSSHRFQASKEGNKRKSSQIQTIQYHSNVVVFNCQLLISSPPHQSF